MTQLPTGDWWIKTAITTVLHGAATAVALALVLLLLTAYSRWQAREALSSPSPRTQATQTGPAYQDKLKAQNDAKEKELSQK